MAPDYLAGYWIKREDPGSFGSEQDFASDPIPPGLRILATITLNAHRVYTSAVRGGFGGEATALIYGWDVHDGGGSRPVNPPAYTGARSLSWIIARRFALICS